MIFKICYRCPTCRAELEIPFIPHYQSTLHLERDLPCWSIPRLTMITTVKDDERGTMKRGWVPREDYENGTEWAVDGEWKNPPPGTLQVAIVPLPEEHYR